MRSRFVTLISYFVVAALPCVCMSASVKKGVRRAKADSMKQEILAQERAGLDALKVGDIGSFARLTGNDAIFIDSSGLASKAEVLLHVKDFKLNNYTIKDVRFVKISSKAGSISYKITEEGVSRGHSFSALAYISSIWKKRKTGWECLLSQESAAKK